MRKNNDKTTINDLAIMIGKGFKGVDKRFEQVDKRFEQVDKRFEQVDKRFGVIEKDLREVKVKLYDFIETCDREKLSERVDYIENVLNISNRKN